MEAQLEKHHLRHFTIVFGLRLHLGCNKAAIFFPGEHYLDIVTRIVMLKLYEKRLIQIVMPVDL